MQHSPFIILPEWVATIDADDTVLTQSAVVVQEGKILAITPRNEAFQRYPDMTRIERPGHLLSPGFINTHTHAAMSLMRGFADDMPLQSWLNDHIWPAEGKWVSPEFVYDGALLSCHEMLLGGTTLFNDMYFFPEATARAAQSIGMRANIGIIVIDFPSAYGTGPDDYLRKGFALRDKYLDDTNVGFTLAPHAPYTVSDEAFKRIKILSEELELQVHIHLHETAFEIDESIRHHGIRPLQRMANLGLIGPNLLAVHVVHLNTEEIRTLKDNNCSVAHCPHSNLKLGSGIAPIGALMDAGVNVAVGTDGSASNNRLDMLGETRTAALLAKGYTHNPEQFSAKQALHAMTMGGAKALGREKELGSIEPGKLADLITIDLSQPQMQPVFDPVSQLIYSADRSQVGDVWIGGRLVAHKQRLIETSAQTAVAAVVSRIGVWQNRLSDVVDH
ncbi:MAG: TRZ/ATZ family hydrolase [Burkholderiaceae bacterium]